MPNLYTKSHRPSQQMDDAIIFVCALNTCRSIVGQAVFNYIKDNTALALRVDSAGIWASEGQPCDPLMRDIAARRGYNLSAYRSTPLETLNPEDYDRVFIFEQAHFESVWQWMAKRSKPEYIMAYSNYFGNQEVLMQSDSDMMSTYTRMFDFIEDGCLGLYNQLQTKKDNDF